MSKPAEAGCGICGFCSQVPYSATDRKAGIIPALAPGMLSSGVDVKEWV